MPYRGPTFTAVVLLAAATVTFLLSSFSIKVVSEFRNGNVQSQEKIMASNSFHWKELAPTKELIWHNCYFRLQCARLNVPLNYSDPDGEVTAIALIRKPSPFPRFTPLYRGPILFNPGGPGGSGIELVKSIGTELSNIVGPRYDIVSFDPRGIGKSTPRVSFFNGIVERILWESPGLRVLNTSVDGVARQWATSKVINQLAGERQYELLRHINTDQTARDMLRIVEAHGREKLLYWGFSYGSILGATFASMFPDKVERIVIDGVVDPEDYYETLWSKNLLDTPKTLDHFYSGCHAAGPINCAFYAPTPTLIARNLSRLSDSIRLQPVPVRTKSSFGIVDYTRFRLTIFLSLYTPYGLFSSLADALADLAEGRGGRMFEMLSTAEPKIHCEDGIDETDDNSVVGEGRSTVLCNDGAKVDGRLDNFQEYFKNMTKRSEWGELWAGIRASCIGWPDIPKANFRGPVGGNTSFPILVVSNTADPVTPLRGAKKVAGMFPGSVVLTQDSPGHCSISAPSLCTVNHIHDYFVDGTLPAPDTVCSVIGSPFPMESGLLQDQSSSRDVFVPQSDEQWNAESQDRLHAIRRLSSMYRLPHPLRM